MGYMIWVRKGIVHLLASVLFLSLLTGTLAASITIAFSHPAKLEAWLSQSNLYSSFVSNAIKQANNTTNNGQPGSNSGSGGISLNDVAVQQAAQSAFSPSLLKQDVNTVLNSNYAWLQGKTSTPNFAIDLTAAKASFAQKVGQYVQARLTGLPVCTAAQLPTAEQQLNDDPLSLTCRPAVLSPAAEGASVTQQLETKSGFLSNSTITASSINPNGGSSTRPYYQKLSYAPKAYQAATKLPWELGGLVVLSAVGIFFIAPTKRRGLRRIGYMLLLAGVLLVAMKFVADAVFKRVETKAFNNSTIGPLQQSLTAFAHRVESQLVNVNMDAGIAFIVLAVAIFVFLIITHSRSSASRPAKDEARPAAAMSADPPSVADSTDGDAAPHTDVEPVDPASPPKPKRPHLIQ